MASSPSTSMRSRAAISSRTAPRPSARLLALELRLLLGGTEKLGDREVVRAAGAWLLLPTVRPSAAFEAVFAASWSAKLPRRAPGAS